MSQVSPLPPTNVTTGVCLSIPLQRQGMVLFPLRMCLSTHELHYIYTDILGHTNTFHVFMVSTYESLKPFIKAFKKKKLLGNIQPVCNTIEKAGHFALHLMTDISQQRNQ